jgi:hypothetical protein
MARLRAPACDTVSATEAFRTEAASVAAAGAGVALSAVCAMKVPRPTRIAAKINMLRIAPHQIRGFADHIMPAGKVRPTMPGEASDFAEKDERSVNGRTCFCFRKPRWRRMPQA